MHMRARGSDCNSLTRPAHITSLVATLPAPLCRGAVQILIPTYHDPSPQAPYDQAARYSIMMPWASYCQ
eukprot:1945602-Rhodomonas_salina.1